MLRDIELTSCVFRTLAPPPQWTLTEWADSCRWVSRGTSPEPGKWKTSRVEYLRGIQDTISDPTVPRVVIQASAQVAKSECILNTIGFFAEYRPTSILFVLPTVDSAKLFSKKRVGPLFRDSPTLRKKLLEDDILYKRFINGDLNIVGSNSPSGLASSPIQVVLFDEVDRFAASSGDEGDPVELAIARTKNFWNRKIIMVSTPTIKGISRIETEFLLSDQRFYFIPCPHCGHMHLSRFENVVWPTGRPHLATMLCPSCKKHISNAQKNIAVSRGEWRATAPFNNIAGFHINELYSPFSTIANIAIAYVQAKDHPHKLQVWFNTCLGETCEAVGETVSEHDLIERCELWPENADVPERVLVLVAGVDTQRDRLEIEVVGWAGGEESWSIDYHVIHGDPNIPEGCVGSPWTDLTDYLHRRWKSESGTEMIIETTCIDSAGSNTQAVYSYVKAHRGARIFAIVGRGGPDKPIIGNPTRRRFGKKNKQPVDVYVVGVDQAKSVIYKRLTINEPGPGYCHFPIGRDTNYFRGLTSERMITKYAKGGRPRHEWHKPSGARNEPLDCRVYAYAALFLRAPQFDKIAFRRLKQRRVLPSPQIQKENLEGKNQLDNRPEDNAQKPAYNERKSTRKRFRISLNNKRRY